MDLANNGETSLPVLLPGVTVAVTGATGFIGGRLVERLARNGAEVTCLIRGMNAGTRLHRAGARVSRLDLADTQAVRAALHGTDIVFHLAYDWGNTAWNSAALEALIAGCLADGCQRLVYVSSFVVYDVPDDGVVGEDMPATPATEGYAHTKLQLEARVLKGVREEKLPASIIQPTIVYGPYCRPWTLDPVEQLRFGTIVLPDRGEGVCNAVYVDDVVSAMVLAAIRPEAIGQRYLVSGPAPITWSGFYEGMARAVGAKGPTYWPRHAIMQANSRAGKIKRLATDPEQVLRRVANIGPARKLVKAGLRVVPGCLRGKVNHRLFGPANQQRGQAHIPSPGHLRFLQGKAFIASAKARKELGYTPAFGFEEGMVPTARFLEDTGYSGT